MVRIQNSPKKERANQVEHLEQYSRKAQEITGALNLNRNDAIHIGI